MSRSYILCSEAYGYPPLMPLATTIRAGNSWTFRDLDTTHDAVVTEPEKATELLPEAVA